MTEQVQDQISAFVDDELSAEECEFLVRRMERDPEFRQKALSYATIGAALRGEILDPDPDVLRRHVQKELGIVPVPIRLGLKEAMTSKRFMRPALGFGIAATVAMVAIFGLNDMNQPSVSNDPTGLIASDVSIVPVGDQTSYVVPQEVSANTLPGDRSLTAPVRMTDYHMTHGEDGLATVYIVVSPRSD
jgi:negative regulator of sigma E activity